MSSLTATSSIAAAASQSPVTRLYTHALTCIFSFATLHDLSSLLGVNHDWQRVVTTMPSLQVQLPALQKVHACDPHQPQPPEGPFLIGLLKSRVCRHVSDFNQDMKLNERLLAMVVAGATRLTVLVCTLFKPVDGEDEDSIPSPLHFPSNLRSLTVKIPQGTDENIVNFRNQVIEAIGQLPHLQELTLCFRSAGPSIDFEPLVGLGQLHSFTLRWIIGGSDFSEAQLASIRQLQHLRSLFLPSPARGGLLSRLLQPDHQLNSLERFSQLGGQFELTTPSAILIGLNFSSSLLELHVHCQEDMIDVDFLLSLTNLQVLTLNLLRNPMARDIVTRGLIGCRNLVNLSIQSSRQISDDLAECLPHMAKLQHLRLSALTHLGHLSFLTRAVSTLASSLLTLDIRVCGEMRSDEIHHIDALHSLERCVIIGSFEDRMEPQIRRKYIPPSRLMPKLKEFKCTAK